jgi:hypothetical protein
MLSVAFFIPFLPFIPPPPPTPRCLDLYIIPEQDAGFLHFP